MGQINRALNRERFLFESVLLGVHPAKDEPGGATRVTAMGTTWLKAAENLWVSAGREPITDEEMDILTARISALPPPEEEEEEEEEEEPVASAGLLESQQALTSDILPGVLQAFRGFQCRTESVCAAARKAINREEFGDGVLLPGCQPWAVEELNACKPNPLMNGLLDTISLYGAVQHFCDPAAEELVRYEESQLLFLAHYDGAHRTLRQFAGYLEPFLDSVRFPFVTPLRQIADFLQEWSLSPCFLPYCASKE